MEARKRRLRSREAVLILAVLSAVALAAFVRLVLFDVVKVEQSSMEPGLARGSTAVILRLAYGLRLGPSYALRWSSPSPGDIVVFRNPFDSALVVKRCVAVAGDPISYEEGGWLRAGISRLPVSPIQAARYFGKGRVGEGMIFAAGDNPGESLDSRDYGLIPVEEVLGKVVLSF
jgi:signal peptidase I